MVSMPVKKPSVKLSEQEEAAARKHGAMLAAEAAAFKEVVDWSEEVRYARVLRTALQARPRGTEKLTSHEFLELVDLIFQTTRGAYGWSKPEHTETETA